MKEWYELSAEREVDPGEFLERRLVSLHPSEAEVPEDFLDALAARVMNSYESQPYGHLLTLRLALPSPTRTHHFYRRLFDHNGNPTQEFITVASEDLALWIEESLNDALAISRGGPHNSDPAFDHIALFGQIEDPVILIAQVKATPNQLQHNCSEALRKFKRLASGDYDAELLNRLSLVERLGTWPHTVTARNLLISPKRMYRVTAVHAEDRDSILILTTYADSITGERSQRHACLFRVVWPDFWQRLATRVYAQLN